MTPRQELQPPKDVIQTALIFLSTLLLFGIVSWLTLSPPNWTKLARRLHRKIPPKLYRLFNLLPIPASTKALPVWLRTLLAPSNDLTVAIRSFACYDSAQTSSLNARFRSFERMSKRHRSLAQTSVDWRNKLDQVGEAISVNSNVCDELAGLGMNLARQRGELIGFRHKTGWRQDGRVVETLKHFVRDWSDEGAEEREALFPPILNALKKEFSSQLAKRETIKVIVPGCGLARLAWEIAALGFDTLANDFSHFMNLGSKLIFEQARIKNQYSLQPFVHNFSHHRSFENMIRKIQFPDLVPREAQHKQTLNRFKFVAGNFLDISSRSDKLDAIITLFFIDTASNLLEYFDQIWTLLKPGGTWFNLGPLLYYGTPSLALSCDDVIRLAESVGFKFEKRETIRQANYTADKKGMYTFAYDCEFWSARKPV